MSSKETDEEEAIGHDSSISAPSKLNKGKQKEGAPPTKKQRAPAASKPNKAPENSGEESASDQPAPALPAKSTKVSKTSEAAVRRKKAAAAGKSAEVPENEESETADASKLMVRESIDDLMTNTAVVEPAQSPQSLPKVIDPDRAARAARLGFARVRIRDVHKPQFAHGLGISRNVNTTDVVKIRENMKSEGVKVSEETAFSIGLRQAQWAKIKGTLAFEISKSNVEELPVLDWIHEERPYSIMSYTGMHRREAVTGGRTEGAKYLATKEPELKALEKLVLQAKDLPEGLKSVEELPEPLRSRKDASGLIKDSANWVNTINADIAKIKPTIEMWQRFIRDTEYMVVMIYDLTLLESWRTRFKNWHDIINVISMNKSTHTREETVEEKTGQRLAAYLDAISDEHERITRLHTELVKDPDFDSDKVEHLDPEKLVSVFDLMLKSSLWGSRAQRDAFDNLGTHLALTFTNNIHFNLGQFAKVETHAAYAPGHKGLIDYSVSAWNYVLYYVFSEDPDFPSPDEVDEALGINIKVTKVNRRKQDAELVTGPKTWEEGEELRRERRAQPQNAAIIRKCSKRFWLMPCRGRLPTPPGWMERMDEGWILHLGDITDAVCNQESPEWNEGFWSWCDHAITALIELAIDSGNPLTPEQIARAKYLFFGYSKFHAKMPYLTMTPIKEMDVAFRSAPVALCELASWAFAHLIHGVAVQGRGGLRMNDASAIFLHFLYTDKHLSTMRWGERQSLSLNITAALWSNVNILEKVHRIISLIVMENHVKGGPLHTAALNLNLGEYVPYCSSDSKTNEAYSKKIAVEYGFTLAKQNALKTLLAPSMIGSINPSKPN